MEIYKTTAAHAAHLLLKATWEPSTAWRIPLSYGDPSDEAAAALKSVGLQDISDIGKLDLKGRNVEDALSSAPLGDTIILRVKPGHAILLTRPGVEDMLADDLRKRAQGACLHVTNVTSALAAFALIGPNAIALLRRLMAIDLRDKRFSLQSSASGELARVHATVHKDRCGSAPCVRVLVGRDVGQYVWTAIATAGRDLGLRPMGSAAAARLLNESGSGS